ncbi:MAG: aldehyde dehydrogenase family protein [Acidobacteriales bacterium]|nr:aldehyde dehydrogenase family protein [Terriglobales bacterium]
MALESSVRSINPATGEMLAEIPCASPDEVQAAVLEARTAQPEWQKMDVSRRLAVIAKFQRLVHERSAAIARTITLEAGKPLVEALSTEIMVVLDAARFLVDHAYRLLQDEALPHGSLAMKAKSGRIVREPLGVVGIISPWNYPFSIPATQSMSALAAGNAVVLKPSEFTTMTARMIAELFRDAGLSQGLLQVMAGDAGTGASLLDSGVDKLVFTGSVSTGKRIAQQAALRLLPVVLELGGKDPMLVLEDADVEIAASGAVWGAFVNAGQACLSIERCYVHERLYKDFLEACVEKTQRLKVGSGLEAGVDIGPMIHLRQLRAVEAQVRDAESQGAQVLVGGRCMTELGPNFYAPTVLGRVSHAMRIMREETFGPVLPVMAISSDDEAVDLANDCEYGLAASVWTRDRARGERLARRIEAGTVMINDAVSCFGISEAPHGGVKCSGIGRTHGRYGLNEMVRLKYIDTDRVAGFKKPWWYEYDGSMRRQMKGWTDAQFAPGLAARLRGAGQAIAALLRGASKGERT